VLTLLRREFPDVTIAKIRFLESQGLVNPERTPSGYRKFYEQDVERLRWVLRQQREHFLPLKVIKGRLEGETSAGEGSGEESRRSKARGRGRVGSSHSAATRGGEGGPAAVLVRSRATLMEDVGEGAGALPSRPGAEKRVAPRARGDGAHDGGAEVQDADAARRLPGLRRRNVPAAEGPVAVVDAGADGGTGVELSVEAFAGTGFTIEELSATSGLEVAEVRQLESYGLLSFRWIGGVAYFDEEALKVACLAKAFANYGVEARHLRLHLLSAQREAGFIEQVVLPLLKQRNPASRERAHEAVVELSRLGQELHAVLLQKRIHELLG